MADLVLGSSLCVQSSCRCQSLAVPVIKPSPIGYLIADCMVRLDCQSDLSASITKLNSKSKLHVIREAPQTLLPKLFRAWNVSHLVFEKDTDAYGRDRDTEIIKLAKDAGVEVIIRTGRTLYDPDELVRKNGNKPTMSLSQLKHVRWGRLG